MGVYRKILHCSALRERPSQRVRRFDVRLAAKPLPQSPSRFLDTFRDRATDGNRGRQRLRCAIAMVREETAGEVNFGSRAVTDDEANRSESDL
jgi:hypothetical protein